MVPILVKEFSNDIPLLNSCSDSWENVFKPALIFRVAPIPSITVMSQITSNLLTSCVFLKRMH